ncbi:MAG: hypothetical protein M1817_006428 [Caeruleum heppii]|nr:MAG: hypothetical protein M1817_006428 [Caeruleum heppii]
MHCRHNFLWILLLAAGKQRVLATTLAAASTITATGSVTRTTDSTCQSRTINYLTHTLPQQCLAHTHSAYWSTTTTTITVEPRVPETALSVEPASTTTRRNAQGNPPESSTEPSQSLRTETPIKVQSIHDDPNPPSQHSANPTDIGSTSVSSTEAATATALSSEEVDSPLDNSNFLSFEEWKKQNLARAGQSSEHVDGQRPPSVGGQNRRRPGTIHNALDSLGEDTEIDLDFTGFVSSAQKIGHQVEPGNGRQPKRTETYGGALMGEEPVEDGQVPQSLRPRGKDAGKTCKERFNYASFDCAATVLKTNPETKAASSILVENKDSYMLNECSATNKFFIVELCEHILIDTIVLANFEFFSSMFRTVRVSVSDRYPVKMDRWRELGTFEARNSREVQAFLVENSLIWARYLRVEILTHHGIEYYCPVSLLRVHGTTMMEEFRHQEETARDEDDLAEDLVSSVAKQVEETASPPESAHDKRNIVPLEGTRTAISASGAADPAWWTTDQAQIRDTLSLQESESPHVSTNLAGIGSSRWRVSQCASQKMKESSLETRMPASDPTRSNDTLSSAATNSSEMSSISSSPTVPSPKGSENRSREPPYSVTSSTHPAPPNPSTQESFFKTIHKRVQLLEANSTLSLQYIEEQSRILRDAFTKVEKRQLAKTTTFLENLNSTVLAELRHFRQQYDEIWQSTVIELENQRESSQQEILAVSARMSILADEVVFQRRMSIFQSALLLLCIGLVIFSRGAASGHLDFSGLSTMRMKSPSTLRLPVESFSDSPASTRPNTSWHRDGSFEPVRSHRRARSDDSVGTPRSPTFEFSPPTPTSVETDSDEGSYESRQGVAAQRSPPPLTGHDQDVMQTRSSPATPTGERRSTKDASAWRCKSPQTAGNGRFDSSSTFEGRSPLDPALFITSAEPGERPAHTFDNGG